MKLRKILAAVAAAAVAVSVMAVNAFAMDFDTEYAGAWGESKCKIAKADLQAIGGDVKVSVTVETCGLLPDQYVFKPMDYDNGWTEITTQCTSDTLVCKADGFVAVQEGTSTVEFVVPAATIDALGDTGIAFQVDNVMITNATIEAGTAQAALSFLDDAAVKDYCFKTGAYAADAAPAAEEAPAEAPAADADTTAAATGNTAAAVIVSVMALAGAAAIVSKKRS